MQGVSVLLLFSIAGTSNLNHDVGSDGKSEFGNAGSSIFDGVSTAWYPIVPNQHNREPSSERYSR